MGLQFGFLIMFEFFVGAVINTDRYKNISEIDLKQLVTKLKDLNVNTSYDLLRKSELDDKEYRFRLNEHKLPELVESKFILVPSYNFDGEIKASHIEQEHVVGSKVYTLSIGSKRRQTELAYANI